MEFKVLQGWGPPGLESGMGAFFSTRSTQPIWSGQVPEWSFATFDCSVMQRFSTLVTGNHFPAQFKIFPGSHTPDPSNELIMTPPVSWIRCVRECLKLCSRESLYNWSREPMTYCWTPLNISVQPAWGLVFRQRDCNPTGREVTGGQATKSKQLCGCMTSSPEEEEEEEGVLCGVPSWQLCLCNA